MKAKLSILVLSLFLALGASISQGMAQPNVNVSVAVGELSNGTFTAKDSFYWYEPIYVVISLQNVGASVYTSAGFEDRVFQDHLRFTLTRPDGSTELITTTFPTFTLRPPRIDPETGDQIEAVEELPAGWVWKVPPYNVKESYLLRSGILSVKAVIAMVTYPESAVQESSGLTYAPLGLADWSGERESNTVNFALLGEFCTGDVHAQVLKMRYTGQDCGASSNSQDPTKTFCEGDPLGASPVRILATYKQEGHPQYKVWFDGEVSLRDPNPLDTVDPTTFDIDATNVPGETRLGGDTFVSIFDEETGALLQTVKFHTSCSQPLNFGDQFGSLRLLDLKLQE